MNDINEMPPKRQYCPYWEVCEYPWVCPDIGDKKSDLQQTCHATDTISRKAAIDAMSDCGICIQRIVDLPYAQQEPKRGKWEMLQMPISPPVYKCSVCGSHALQSMTGCLMNRHYEANLTNYCPNCGARMEK